MAINEKAASALSLIGTALLLPFLLRHQDNAIRVVYLAYGLLFGAFLLAYALNRIAFPHIRFATPLLPVLCLALTARLVAASSPGHGYDLPINMGWARSAVELGLARSYVEQLDGNILPNYPPAIVTLYWLCGHAYRAFIASTIDLNDAAFGLIVRLPSMAADLLICLALTRIVTGTGMRNRWLYAALAYAVHPVAIYDGAYWGQTDSIYALEMALTLLAAARCRWGATGALTACALLTKPQATAMLPLVALLLLRQPRQAAVPFTAGAILAGTALLLPFIVGGTLPAVANVYLHVVGGYHDAVSTNAYNFWAIFHRTAQQSDTELAFGIVSFRKVGLVLAGAGVAWVLFQLRQALVSPRSHAEHLRGVMIAGALTTSAMFLFATEMHERYQFAYVVLALPFALRTVAGGVLYTGTCVLILLNLLGAMAFGAFDMFLYRSVPATPKIIGVLQVVLFFVTTLSASREVLHARRH